MFTELTRPYLAILPGPCWVLFLVGIGPSLPVLTVRSGLFLEGLRLACDLLSFAELQREDLPLEELLPWAGNV
jgi:hypothetical protein